jgi:tRNA (guanine26-N2/guanine27-N2)-dimethyltransferase
VFGEVLAGALLAVDDDEHTVDDGTGVPQRFDGVDGALARRGDVFEHDDLFAFLELALYLVARAVLLGLLPDDDVWVVRLDGRRGHERYRPEGDAGEFRRADALCERLCDEFQTAGVGLEDVLVDVILRNAAVGEFELPELHRFGTPKRVDEFLVDHTCVSVVWVKSGAESPSETRPGASVWLFGGPAERPSMQVREGGVEIEVPEERHGASEGAGPGVFYNPVQELNRDITVGVLRAVADDCDSYLDAMTASGIRAVRAADAGYDVTGCDIDTDAVALARQNLDANGLDGDVAHRNVNAHMHESSHDVVDLDPFGTPIPFADAAFRSAKRYVCVTATDTAPLCGAHFESGVRSYGAVPRNTEFHSEVGLRVLLSALIRTAARYDIAARPVLSHVSSHYVRTYLELEGGAKAANDQIDQLGYLDHCQQCLWRDHERTLIADPTEECPNCGQSTWTAGAIWLGSAHDADFVERVASEIPASFGEATKAHRLLDTIADELHQPTHYDQHKLYKRWGEPNIAMDDFLAALRDAGHEASRAHYGGTTFKTDADVVAIRDAVE